MKHIITIKQGSCFPKVFLYFGYVSIIMGIIFLYENVIVGVGIIAIACFVVFMPCGMQFNINDKLYKNYFSILGMKMGKWKSYKSYRCITVLTKYMTETTYGGATPISITTRKPYYDLYLLSDTPKEKLLLKRFKNAEDANETLHNLSGKLDIEICI